jgi:hypothetical protein
MAIKPHCVNCHYWASYSAKWGECSAVEHSLPEREQLAIAFVYELIPGEQHGYQRAQGDHVHGGLQTHATFGCTSFQPRPGAEGGRP